MPKMKFRSVSIPILSLEPKAFNKIIKKEKVNFRWEIKNLIELLRLICQKSLSNRNSLLIWILLQLDSNLNHTKTANILLNNCIGDLGLDLIWFNEPYFIKFGIPFFCKL